MIKKIKLLRLLSTHDRNVAESEPIKDVIAKLDEIIDYLNEKDSQ